MHPIYQATLAAALYPHQAQSNRDRGANADGTGRLADFATEPWGALYNAPWFPSILFSVREDWLQMIPKRSCGVDAAVRTVAYPISSIRIQHPVGSAIVSKGWRRETDRRRFVVDWGRVE
jgi:hypothetical protein